MGGVLPRGEDAAVGIADVIERLRTIEASAPASDGVACFARLYLAVTEGVGADLTGRGFADARFLETLDVHFAGLFFAALESYDPTPRARRPRGFRCSTSAPGVASLRCSSRLRG